MGKSVNNSGGGVDYATGEYYFEFHRRLVVSREDFDRISQLFEAGQNSEAGEALKSISPENAHSIIDACLAR